MPFKVKKISKQKLSYWIRSGEVRPCSHCTSSLIRCLIVSRARFAWIDMKRDVTSNDTITSFGSNLPPNLRMNCCYDVTGVVEPLVRGFKRWKNHFDAPIRGAT